MSQKDKIQFEAKSLNDYLYRTQLWAGDEQLKVIKRKLKSTAKGLLKSEYYHFPVGGEYFALLTAIAAGQFEHQKQQNVYMHCASVLHNIAQRG